jgi:hypothetical protein
MSCSFEALYHAERLHVVNPTGDVGIVTLWSPLRSAKRRLAEISAELLDPRRSRVAVISNLYGDGMYAMLCNLLYNPRVRHLIAIGQDLGLPTCDELEAFLEHGLEDATMLGAPVKRIRGTGRVFPAIAQFHERRLRERLSFSYLGKLSSERLPYELMARLRELPSENPGDPPPKRIRVDLDTGDRESAPRRPSQLGAHQVVRRRPLDCWEELVVRTVRFGRAVKLGNGPRLELLDVKAVITDPERESSQALERRGFQFGSLLDYEQKMLRAELPEETSYTYGNRLREHFQGRSGPLDTLDAAIDRLRANSQTRHAYISLWDNSLDLDGQPSCEAGDPNARTGELTYATGAMTDAASELTHATGAMTDAASELTHATGAMTDAESELTHATGGMTNAAGEAKDGTGELRGEAGAPCLTTLLFRNLEDRLSLTATYRSHNLLTAWLRNVYGLMAVQRHVAAGCGLETGPITVISHSLGLDPSSPHFQLARALNDGWKRDDDRDSETGKYSLREDPNGYFVVGVDKQAGSIVAEHRFGGVLVKRYSGERADALVKEIGADMAVSLVSHALWLGGELARHEAILGGGAPVE